MCIEIFPKRRVASVIGFLKGKSAIAIARHCVAENATSPRCTSELGVMQSQPLDLNPNKFANTSATKRQRMDQLVVSKMVTKARFSATIN